MLLEPLDLVSQQNVRIFEIQDGGSHHLDKSNKSQYLRNRLMGLKPNP